MSVLPIYLYGADELRQKAPPVGALDNDTIKLIYDMFETMSQSNGIGLAATQVGVMKRVVVIDITPTEEETDETAEKSSEDDQPKKLVLINPEILSHSGTVSIEEGCLSIPDVRAEVNRAETITVRFRNANFEEVELEAAGLLARVILHEIDHLDGILFIDHLSTAKRGLLRPKLRKIKKGEVDASYPVVVPTPRRKSRVEV